MPHKRASTVLSPTSFFNRISKKFESSSENEILDSRKLQYVGPCHVNRKPRPQDTPKTSDLATWGLKTSTQNTLAEPANLNIPRPLSGVTARRVQRHVSPAGPVHKVLPLASFLRSDTLPLWRVLQALQYMGPE